MNMGRKSVKKDKNIYQTAREQAGLTRRQASERLDYISENRIEKIEGGRTQIQPAEVLAMEAAYQDGLLVNRHCTTQCAIGRKTVTPVASRPLAETVIEILALKEKLTEAQSQLLEAAGGFKTPEETSQIVAEEARLLRELGRCGFELDLYLSETRKTQEREEEKHL